MTDEKEFTEMELRRFDGETLPMYIAFKGIVYDVGNCPKWRSGIHERLHFPAQDLTSEMTDAPHSDSVFANPCVVRVGRLVSNNHR